MSIQSMISNIFGSTAAAQPTAQPQQQQQVTPGNIPAGTGLPAAPLANTENNGVVPEQKKDNATPLDEFTDLWKTTPTDPNAQPADTSIFGKVNADELMKAASAIDFTKVITPEMMQNIQAGGEVGTKALMEALNKTQQLGYAQSAHATTILVEQAIKKAREQFMQELPQHIRDRNTHDLIKESPVYSHPAAQPLIDAMTVQLQRKFPTATPKELAEMANKYVTGFADVVKGKPEQQSSKSEDGEDWTKYLN